MMILLFCTFMFAVWCWLKYLESPIRYKVGYTVVEKIFAQEWQIVRRMSGKIWLKDDKRPWIKMSASDFRYLKETWNMEITDRSSWKSNKNNAVVEDWR